MKSEIIKKINQHVDSYSTHKNKENLKESISWLVENLIQESAQHKYKDNIITITPINAFINVKFDGVNKREIEKGVFKYLITIEDKSNNTISFKGYIGSKLENLNTDTINTLLNNNESLVQLNDKITPQIIDEFINEQYIDTGSPPLENITKLDENHEFYGVTGKGTFTVHNLLKAYFYMNNFYINNENSIDISKDISDIINNKKEDNTNQVLQILSEYNKYESITKSLTEINFINSAKNEKIRGYRYQLIEWLRYIEKESTTSTNLFNEIKKHPDSNSIFINADNGIFPLKELLEDYIPPGSKNKEKFLIRCLSLSNQLYSYHCTKRAIGYMATDMFGQYEKMVEFIKDEKPPHMVKHNIFKSLSTHIQEIGDSLTIRDIKNKFNWLLKSNSYVDSSLDFTRKYKPETMVDFSDIIETLIEPAINRIYLEHAKKGNVEQDAFQINDSTYKIDADLTYINDNMPNKGQLKDINQYYLQKALDSGFYIDKAKANNKLHLALRTYNQALAAYHKEDNDISWTALCEDIDYGSHTVSCIRSRTELLNLATELKHCAYSYLEKCMSGESYIFEIRTEGQLPTSFELEYNSHEDRFISKQHYGYENSPVPKNSEEQEIHDIFLQDLNEGVIHHDSNIIVKNDHLIDKIRSTYSNERIQNTLQTARAFSKYDFGSDAAFLSYFIVEKIMGEKCLHKLFENANMLDTSLDFFKTIEKVKYIANKTDLTSTNLIIKAKNKGVEVNSKQLSRIATLTEEYPVLS